MKASDHADSDLWPEVDPEFLRLPERAEISSDPHAVARHVKTVESLWRRRHQRALSCPPTMDDDGLVTLERDRGATLVRYRALADDPKTIGSVRSRALMWLVVLGDFSRVEQLAELVRAGARADAWYSLSFIKYLRDLRHHDVLRHPSLLAAMHAASELPGDDGRPVCDELRHLGVPLTERAVAANDPPLLTSMFGTSPLLDELDPRLLEDLLSLRMIGPDDVQRLQRLQVSDGFFGHNRDAYAFEELGLRMSYDYKDDAFPAIHSRLLDGSSSRFCQEIRALLPMSHVYQFHTPQTPEQEQADEYTCCAAFVARGWLCRVRLDVFRNYWKSARWMGFLNQVLARLDVPKRFISLRDGWTTLCTGYFGELESFRELVARHPQLFDTSPSEVQVYALDP